MLKCFSEAILVLDCSTVKQSAIIFIRVQKKLVKSRLSKMWDFRRPFSLGFSVFHHGDIGANRRTRFGRKLKGTFICST